MPRGLRHQARALQVRLVGGPVDEAEGELAGAAVLLDLPNLLPRAPAGQREAYPINVQPEEVHAPHAAPGQLGLQCVDPGPHLLQRDVRVGLDVADEDVGVGLSDAGDEVGGLGHGVGVGLLQDLPRAAEGLVQRDGVDAPAQPPEPLPHGLLRGEGLGAGGGPLLHGAHLQSQLQPPAAQHGEPAPQLRVGELAVQLVVGIAQHLHLRPRRLPRGRLLEELAQGAPLLVRRRDHPDRRRRPGRAA